MKLNHIYIFIFLASRFLSATSQSTYFQDTLTFEEIIPTEADQFGCAESVNFQIPADRASSFFEIIRIKMIVKGNTIDQVRPIDISLKYSVLENGNSAIEDIAGPDTAGNFENFPQRLNIANGIYTPIEIITFQIQAQRSYINFPSNPRCGTEEAYLNHWAIVVNYYADDKDQDGYSFLVDCDDDNFQVNPGAYEQCDNLMDDNCNGAIDEERINALDSLAYGAFPIWSLGLPQECDQVIIPDGSYWPFYNYNTPFPGFLIEQVQSVKVEPGGSIRLGDNIMETLLTRGSYLITREFEVQKGAILEMYPRSLITPFDIE